MTKPPDNLLQAIRTGHRFVVSSHVNPDGDAIGSALGLARILRAMGKGAVLWLRDECPALYRPLPGSDGLRCGEEPPAKFPETFDAAIVLECPSLDRTGLAERLGELPVLNVDHHLGNEHYGKVNWIDTAAPSVGEMIYRLAKGLNVTPDRDTATSLYLTLVTDTGGFRFANATPEAFEAAAELVRGGAQPQRVAQWLYESRPEGSMRLLGEMLGTLKLHNDGRVATVVLDSAMFERAAASPSDTEGLVDYPRSIAGVETAALIRELGDGKLKVSMRSRGEVDIQKLALKHGGGGHRNAAGYTAEGTLEEVRDQVAELLAGVLG